MKKTCYLLLLMVALASLCAAQVPASNHVVLVLEENHSYSSVIGSGMPYLSSLASQYGLATQYYANTHPSIGNYFMFTTGQILTNDDSQTPSSFPVSADNIVRELLTAGKTWKAYAEDLPYAGYTGGDTGNYAVRHNPFAYFTDVQNSSVQKMNLVPFTQFAADLANNQLPNFTYIVPNLNDDAHNGTLQQADSWLQTNIAPLLASPMFQAGGDGILIIAFDESFDTDTAYGGGQVATLVLGPRAKLGYKSTTLYQHPNLLKTLLTALGASTFPGASFSAAAMADFFTTSTTPTGSVTVTAPVNGATVTSPVQVVASATSSPYSIASMTVYVDGASAYTVKAASVNTSLTMAAGTHSINVVATDTNGNSYSKTVSVTVASTSTASASAATYRISAGGGAYTDTLGQLWQADAYYNTGNTYSTTSAIAGTSNPAIYQKQRWDDTPSPELQYTLPVTNGTYQVNLHFAEIYSGAMCTGCRLFNVVVDGVTAFSNLDVYSRAGANTALVLSTTTTVSNGSLTILFQHVVQNPMISGIEVIPLSSTTTSTSGSTGTLQGTVTSTSGTAIAGATVSYGTGSTTTDANGNYQLTVAAGSYTVTAAASGYVSASTTASITAGTTTTANFALVHKGNKH